MNRVQMNVMLIADEKTVGMGKVVHKILGAVSQT